MSINKIQNFQLLPLMITLAMAMSLCTACSEMGEIIGRGSKDSALTLYVPLANKFDTRADGDADELKYTSLIFCAFSKDGASKTYVADLLDTDEANSNLSFYPTYKAYEIDLKEGDYHFYLHRRQVAMFESSKDPQMGELKRRCLKQDKMILGALKCAKINGYSGEE